MELRHLRYFLAVAEELHFNRAAQRLQIQQPPLSQQIRQLETELGVDLFVRTTRSVRLTEAGRTFMEHAYEAIEVVERARKAAVMAAQGLTGKLRVGFTGSATYALLPLVAKRFKEAYPNAALEARGELITSAQVAALLSRQLDVAFGRLLAPVPELELRVVRRERLEVALPADHPLTACESVRVADLADQNFVTLPGRWGSTTYELTIRACADAGFSPHVLQEVSQTSTVIGLVAAGFGVALVPESCRHINVTGAVYRPIAGEAPRSDVVMAWRRNNEMPLLRQFLALFDHEI
ncbi:DNA-binding transcriptional LysR family regulator [Antricoccus suffuscus]|uniref:DNA-binding transcriptional LysR family regulator n=1 Tax=Antricoccus suffuscus TaxID=1629062 RepID=A0A2T1A5Q6_9ACTN|nr:LysR substrate-binding domain-containing protein [Antricoccus suffuscus]PRZ43945.1 DNA-binding transcriptional LysR family regulator [Antricoccus suffuscus]